MLIPQSFISDLLARTNIVDVLSQSLTLKKRGSNYICCCPFHNEKTPSFSVSETKQIYKCFGCGQSGNVLSFLMEYSHLTYVEAIEFLARFHGITVPRENNNATANNYYKKNKDDKYEKLTSIMKQAADYYYSQLKQSAIAINYCKERGISGQIAKYFYLGFAPDGWNNLKVLCDNNLEKYHKDDNLKLAGLTIEHEQKKQRYDRFRNRLMIPIFDIKGNIIAFGGRILTKANQHSSENKQNQQVKYLNSPETPIFIKGQGLFGLYQAKNFIRQNNDEIIVCEGYLDVIMLKQFGVDNAIATLGTATTPQQIRLLLRYAKKVIFCFDGDNAGRTAAFRAMQNALPEIPDDKILEFAFLPQDEDPDSFVRKFGREKFKEFLHNAETTLTLSRFFIEYLQSKGYDLTTAEGRSQFLNEASNFLPLMQKSPLLQIQLIKQVAEISKFSVDEVNDLCKVKVKKHQQIKTFEKSENIQQAQNIKVQSVQKIQISKRQIFRKFENNASPEFSILKLLLKYPKWFFDENLETSSFSENSVEKDLLLILQNIAFSQFNAESIENTQDFYQAVSNFFENSADIETQKLQGLFEKLQFNTQDLPLKNELADYQSFQNFVSLLKNNEQQFQKIQRLNYLIQKISQNSLAILTKEERSEYSNLIVSVNAGKK